MWSLVCGVGRAYATDVRRPCRFSRIAAIIGIVISDRYSSSPVTKTTCGPRAVAAGAAMPSHTPTITSSREPTRVMADTSRRGSFMAGKRGRRPA